MMALAMHSDSDKDSYEERFRHKFTPVFESLKDNPAGCDILIPNITYAFVREEDKVTSQDVSSLYALFLWPGCFG